MKNVLPNSFEFLIHQFNSLNRELIHELWINSSIQPVSESYAQRFYHWGHAGVREIFRQQTLGCPLEFTYFSFLFFSFKNSYKKVDGQKVTEVNTEIDFNNPTTPTTPATPTTPTTPSTPTTTSVKAPIGNV